MLYPDFTFRLDDDLKEPIMVDIYRDHLEQVLVILCDNAVKYSTDDHKEIHIILSRGMNTVEIGIQDFGEGISPENVKRVFDRFYRVDKVQLVLDHCLESSYRLLKIQRQKNKYLRCENRSRMRNFCSYPHFFITKHFYSIVFPIADKISDVFN